MLDRSAFRGFNGRRERRTPMEQECPCIEYAVRRGPIGRFAAQAAIRMNKPTSFFMVCGPSLHEYIELHKQEPQRQQEKKAMSFAPESNFLKAEDLPEGQDLVVTITGLEEKKLGDQTKWVLSFKELEKDLVLNTTRRKALGAAAGTFEEDEVVGKKISLYVGEANFKGETFMVPSIRAKAPKAGVSKAAAKPAVAEDDDFPG